MSNKEGEELINYWLNGSDSDYDAMMNLFKSGNYTWCLFIAHIVIEKLFKGLYAKINYDTPYASKTHNLLKLAEDCKIELDNEKINCLTVINTFNISARYDDYKNEFSKKCNKEYTQEQINKIEVIQEWLKSLIKA